MKGNLALRNSDPGGNAVWRTVRGVASPHAGRRALSSDEATLAILAWALVLGILSQKIAFVLAPGVGLQLALFIEYGALLTLMPRQRAKFTEIRLIGTLVFFVTATLVNVLTVPTLTSLTYLFAIYAPLAIVVPIKRASFFRLMNVFQMLACFVAALTILDWTLQMAGLPMPNFDHVLNNRIRLFNFNYIQPLNWGSPWYKPNAFFFLEVSYVSQLICTAIIIEACYFRRFAQLGLLITGQVLTFSGTGMVLLLVGLPGMIYHIRPKLVVAALLLMPLAGITAVSIGLVDNVLERTTEFGHEGSSGNQRFMGQFEEIGRNFSKDTRSVLVGIGAGQMLKDGHVVWTPLTKMTVEYGLIVSAIYFTLLCLCMFSGGIPFQIGFILVFQYAFLNGGLLVPVNALQLLLMCAILKIQEDRTDARALSIRPAQRITFRARPPRSTV